MKICWDNLEGIYITRKTRQFKKGSNTYIEKKCIICNEYFLGKKYSKSLYCSYECGSKSESHYNPIIKEVNKIKKKERVCKEYKYYDNPKICIECNNILTYEQSIIRGSICCSHKCSQKRKWKNKDYAMNFSEKLIENWDKKLDYNINEWNGYKLEVRRLSARNYRKYKRIINPQKLKIGKENYHVDHKFSVFDGFRNNVDIDLISHPVNLQVIRGKENLQKGYSSSISLDELLTEKELFRK